MATARTATGCWTCRIRRKKCDDVHPFCGPCNFRQLTCHGYGPKPAWMDSAENQKAEVERIKRSVSENFRSRRAFRVSKKQAGQSCTVQATKLTPKSRLSHQEDDLDQSASNISQLQIDDSQNSAVCFPLVDPRPPVADIPRPPWQHGLQSLPSISADAPERISLQESRRTAYPSLFHPDAPPADNEHDFAMIMNYLDNIFPLQFYFYQPSSAERGRGWLLSLLLRAKSSYFTALAFSSLHQIMFVYKDDIDIKQNLSMSLDKYHSLALSELHKQLDYLPTISGYEHLKMGVEILACMTQLMSIEVFRETKEYQGPNEDWEVHLQAAGDVLSVIGMDLGISSTSSPSSASDNDEEPIQQLSEVERATTLLPLDEIAGLDFFMKVYIWGDVFRCASIGLKSPDRDPFPYLAYLEEDRIRLDHIMGCRNWVMILLKEISNLETWKKDMKSRRTLSIPTLSRIAASLEQRLYAGLESVMENQNKLTKLEQECNLVTQIYALSAVTYLAIVVSGNSHLLLEVRSSVAKTLTALKTLPPNLLIRISWAYCVACCMADETEKEEFRQLLISADKAGHNLGTLWNGFEIAEEFWILRENLNVMQATDKCAWALAMDHLGSKILLI